LKAKSPLKRQRRIRRQQHKRINNPVYPMKQTSYIHIFMFNYVEVS